MPWILAFLGCVGVGTPPEAFTTRPRISTDVPDDLELGLNIRAKAAAGCWNHPVHAEAPLNLDHLGASSKGHSIYSTRYETDPGGFPSLKAAVVATVEESNRNQERFPESRHYLSEVIWIDGDPAVTATEVITPNGTWIPAVRLLDPVVTIDLEATCRDVLGAIVRQAQLAQPRVSRLSRVELIAGPPNGGLPRGQCALHTTGTARDLVVNVLHQLESQTSIRWSYVVAPKRLFWPDHKCKSLQTGKMLHNRKGTCNRYALWARVWTPGTYQKMQSRTPGAFSSCTPAGRVPSP